MTDQRQYTHRNRPRRSMLWVSIALVLLLAAGYRVASSISVKGKVSVIRKRGLPTTALELDTWYKHVPASSNAARVILEAVSEHLIPVKGKDPDELKARIIPGEPLPPELVEAVSLYARKNGLALERIDEAAELTGSRYPIDLSRGVATLMPHLAQVKHLAQLVKWAAIDQSAEGNVEDAVHTLESGFALAASLEPEPVLISELVRISCVTVLLQAVERVVSEHALTEEQLTHLNAAVRKAEESGKTAGFRAMVGERAIGIPLFHLSYGEYVKLGSMGGWSSDGEAEALKAGVYMFRQAVGLQNTDLAFYLETMGGLERAMQMDYAERLAAVTQISQKVDAEIGTHRWKYMMSGMLVPSLTGAAKKEALLVARLRCAQVALAIERHRARHGGKLPRLDELVPDFVSELPRDPVDNAALEYRLRGGKGYQILAAEATRLANEGRRPTNRQDVAFTVAR